MKHNVDFQSPRHRRLFSQWRQTYRRHHVAIGWGIVVVVAVAAVLLGTVGFAKNLTITEPDKQYSIATLIFMALQMLVLNAGASSEPIGWELEIARVLAVAAFSGAVLKTVAAVFRQQWEAVSVRFLLRSHVIVCGSDQKGSRLAIDLLAEGESVVVVEREAENRDVEKLRVLGEYIVAGDASHPQTLVNAGVNRANRLLIAYGDDAANVEIAAAASEACRDRRSSKLARLVIHVHCVDHRLFGLLAASSSHANAGSRVEHRRFDVLLNDARLLFEEHPLDRLPISPDSTSVVQLVLLGYSRESECLLLQTARLGHFANLHRPRVIVVDPDAALHGQRLRFRFPHIDNVCQLEFVSRDLDHSDTVADIERWVGDETAITALVVGPTDEDQPLPLALGLPPVVGERDVPVFVRLCRREELANLLKTNERRPRLIPFGSLARAGSSKMVIQEELDILAKAIHEEYVRKRTADGDSPIKFPAMRDWAELTEDFKEASRDQADHISVKLRAVGCIAVQQDELQGRELATWSAEEIEILAKMEHQRWNANRWLNNWRRGPRDDAKKLHPNLVPWDELDEKTRDYDRNPMRNIPDHLRLVGQVIVRDKRVT